MSLCGILVRFGCKPYIKLIYKLNFSSLKVGVHWASLRLGIDLRLFHILVEHEGVPVSASQLAELSKSELLLIGM